MKVLLKMMQGAWNVIHVGREKPTKRWKKIKPIKKKKKGILCRVKLIKKVVIIISLKQL